MQISTLEDIQKLEVKDLKEILCSNSEATSGIKEDLVLKVYTIFVRHVLRPGENQQQSSNNTGEGHQNTTENSGDFKYNETLRRISALGLFSFTISWLCQRASTVTLCSREQILRN